MSKKFGMNRSKLRHIIKKTEKVLDSEGGFIDMPENVLDYLQTTGPLELIQYEKRQGTKKFRVYHNPNWTEELIQRDKLSNSWMGRRKLNRRNSGFGFEYIAEESDYMND